MADANQVNPDWLEVIAKSIQGLRYGHVQITFHDGKIVQIDRMERRRFDPTPLNSKAAVNKKSKPQE